MWNLYWTQIYFTDLVVIGCLPELYDLLVPGLPGQILLTGRCLFWPPHTGVVDLIWGRSAGVEELAIPNVLVLGKGTEPILVLRSVFPGVIMIRLFPHYIKTSTNFILGAGEWLRGVVLPGPSTESKWPGIRTCIADDPLPLTFEVRTWHFWNKITIFLTKAEPMNQLAIFGTFSIFQCLYDWILMNLLFLMTKNGPLQAEIISLRVSTQF